MTHAHSPTARPARAIVSALLFTVGIVLMVWSQLQLAEPTPEHGDDAAPLATLNAVVRENNPGVTALSLIETAQANVAYGRLLDARAAEFIRSQYALVAVQALGALLCLVATLRYAQSDAPSRVVTRPPDHAQRVNAAKIDRPEASLATTAAE